MKTFGHRLDKLRVRLLAAGSAGCSGTRCRTAAKAPTKVRAAFDQGAEPILVWGGDGMVPR